MSNMVLRDASASKKDSRIVSYERKGCHVLMKSMIGCLSPDLFVSKNRHKNLVMTKGKDIIDSFVKLGLDA